jgi:hypothetical protein
MKIHSRFKLLDDAHCEQKDDSSATPADDLHQDRSCNVTANAATSLA